MMIMLDVMFSSDTDMPRAFVMKRPGLHKLASLIYHHFTGHIGHLKWLVSSPY